MAIIIAPKLGKIRNMYTPMLPLDGYKKKWKKKCDWFEIVCCMHLKCAMSAIHSLNFSFEQMRRRINDNTIRWQLWKFHMEIDATVTEKTNLMDLSIFFSFFCANWNWIQQWICMAIIICRSPTQLYVHFFLFGIQRTRKKVVLVNKWSTKYY